jgi:AsmA protein
VKPSLVATASGQEGKEAGGITVPVHLHGPFDAIKYDVDYGALISNTARDNLRDRLNQQLNQRLGGAAKGGEGAPADRGSAPADPRDQVRDAVRDRLKGILGR